MADQEQAVPRLDNPNLASAHYLLGLCLEAGGDLDDRALDENAAELIKSQLG